MGSVLLKECSLTIKRTYDLDAVRKATDEWKHELIGFIPDFWLSIPNNVALINNKGDVGLFERAADLPNTVYGHYFYFSRGKEALKTAREMLKEIFTGPYDVTSVVGITPLDKRGALWMNRQLGFRHDEEVMTEAGPARFVLLTKQEWESPHG